MKKENIIPLILMFMVVVVFIYMMRHLTLWYEKALFGIISAVMLTIIALYRIEVKEWRLKGY